MTVLILGYGTVGSLVARLVRSSGESVIAVRRTAASPPSDGEPEPFLRRVQGDISSDSFWREVFPSAAQSAIGGAVRAIVLCANPGIRRGRDNGLARAATLAANALPMARLVYTGTTAVYADAQGREIDESGAVLTDDPQVVHLLAIETAVLAHPLGLVLRIPALVGPSRQHALERLRSGSRTVRGDLGRPFSFLHEEDLAEVLIDALAGHLGIGILNVASPERISAADYYQALAQAAGTPAPVGDGSPVPRRRIDAGRLWAALPTRPWRSYRPK